MTEQISWDHSLIKKFGVSNHFKLLNQLRNEVKKYPLKKNKYKQSSHSSDENKNDYNSNQNILNNQNQYNTKKTNDSNENNIIQSTISFNNSKNFSIYSKNEVDSVKEKDDSVFLDDNNSNQDSSNSTFKDRLNKIDMK